MSTIMTVRELIHLAFGDKDKNGVNFKHIETVIFLMARQLSVLKRQIEVDIDPMSIHNLKKTPSNLSVTEVKIHASIPEELERELHEMTSDDNADAATKKRRSTDPTVKDSQNNDTKPKIQQEKYLAVKRRDSEDSDKYETVSVVTKEQYLALLQEILELSKTYGSGTSGVPNIDALRKQLQRTTSITHAMSAVRLSERLEESEKKLQQMIAALETLVENIYAQQRITSPNNNENQTSHDKNVIVSHALQVKYYKKQSSDSSKHTKSSIKQSKTFWTEKYSTRDELTQNLYDSANNGEQFSQPVKNAEFVLQPPKTNSIGTSRAVNESFNDHKKPNEEISMKNKNYQKGDKNRAMKSVRQECTEASFDFTTTGTALALSEQTASTSSISTDDRRDRTRQSRLHEYVVVSDMPAIGGMHSKTSKFIKKLKVRKLVANSGKEVSKLEPNFELDKDLPDFTDFLITMDMLEEVVEEKAMSEIMDNIYYDKEGNIISLSHLHDYDDVYDENGKIISRLYDEKGNLIPRSQINYYDKNRQMLPLAQLNLNESQNENDTVLHLIETESKFYDKDGNLMSRSKIDNLDDYDDVYDENGKIISRLYDEKGNLIPRSQINNYDKNRQMLPLTQPKLNELQNENDTVLHLIETESKFYDKDGNLMSRSKIDNLDDYDDVYDENGKIISRLYDEKGNLIPRSQINNYDKNRQMLPLTQPKLNELQNENDKVLHLIETESKFYDKDGNLMSRSKIYNLSEVYDEFGNLISIHDKNKKITLKSLKNEIEEDSINEKIKDETDHTHSDNSQNKANKEYLRDKNEEFSPFYDEKGNLIPWSKVELYDNIYDKNGNPIQRVYDKQGNAVPWSEIDEVNEIYDEQGRLIPRLYNENGTVIPWAKTNDTETTYDKHGNDLQDVLESTEPGYFSKKENLDSIKRPQDFKSLQRLPSFVTGDRISRSYSGQKPIHREGISLKNRDWVIHKDLKKAMDALQQDLNGNINLTSARSNEYSQKTAQILTKMREELNEASELYSNKIPDLDSEVTQFSQRITALECQMAKELTLYQDEIEQQQNTLEMALEAMAEAIANITADPQAVADLLSDLINMKNDIDALNLSQRNLSDMLNNLKLDIRELTSQIQEIRSHKANREEVDEALEGKATIADLNQVISREHFTAAMTELFKQIMEAYDKFNNQEYTWQMAIDALAKCFNSKASNDAITSLSEDIQANVNILNEKTKYLSHIVGKYRDSFIKRQIDREGACLCCRKAVVESNISNSKTQKEFKDNTSAEASEKESKENKSRDRILCYPGQSLNHQIDPRSAFCDHFCGGPVRTSSDRAVVSIPEEIIVTSLLKSGVEKTPKNNRKPCSRCNPSDANKAEHEA